MVRLLCLLVVLLGPVSAWAAESAPVSSPRLTATLVSDVDAVTPGVPFGLALRLRMAPGWHTYWQNPGDAGAPPEFSVTGADIGPIAWPAPARQPEGPVMTYGYSGEVLLPVRATTTGPATITAEASWLVCEKICVPEHGTFTLSLSPKEGRNERNDPPAATNSAEAPLFTAASARVPRPSPFPARIAPDGTLTLTGQGLSAATVREAWFVPDVADTIVNAAPQSLEVTDGRVAISLRPGTAFGSGLAGVVTLRDPSGQESYLHVDAAPGPATASLPLIETLGFALLGGLILNLMPCVFPVLAMKAMAVARMPGQLRGAIRVEALAYTAGVLVAFGALGLVLVGLRGAGAAAGWGFQFQSPVFVAGMAWVLFAVGLNLSGVYEVAVPGTGAGQRLAGQGGPAGSFFTGLLAALVATPCTAPFMGAAIAAALAAPVMVTAAVFLAMGLGLAAPYLVLAFIPGLARLLPRPGAWMDTLRGALAFPMYAAAAWLFWVLAQQAGPDGVLAGAAGLVLLAFAAWSLGRAQRAGVRWGLALAGMAVAAALALLPGLTTAASGPVPVAEGTEPFTPARLATLRAEGRPVFVNMTASWCVTCLVNERLALSPAAVREAFRARGVVYLKGDWTRQDPGITAFLREHGRDGVPLYVLYAPGQEGVVLGQVLTEGAVLAEVGRL